jgi:alpha-tubulin suppressor-like RCC1 family protein
LFTVGGNTCGCIGDGTTKDCLTTKKMKFFCNTFIADVACGEYHCLSISNKGEIYSWGNNASGQLGKGKRDYGNQLTPIKIFKI